MAEKYTGVAGKPGAKGLPYLSGCTAEWLCDLLVCLVDLYNNSQACVVTSHFQTSRNTTKTLKVCLQLEFSFACV